MLYYTVKILSGIAKGSYRMPTMQEAQEFVAAWQSDTKQPLTDARITSSKQA